MEIKREIKVLKLLKCFLKTKKLNNEINMKKLTIGILLTILSISTAYSGNCDYSWQTASDGSRCGKRSAEYRPGGYEPTPRNNPYSSQWQWKSFDSLYPDHKKSFNDNNTQKW